LLPNVLAKGVAAAAGATEAILLAEGCLREGSSSSVMVVKDGIVHAPPEGPYILPSTTRTLALELARRNAIPIRITDISEAQLRDADEVMLGFATRGVLPVCRIDGRNIGTGQPGAVWNRLQDAFEAYRAKVSVLPMDQEG
jgi:D-alanine transaminase